MEPEELHIRLGRLVQTMPNLQEAITDDVYEWLGDAYVLVTQVDQADALTIKLQSANISRWDYRVVAGEQIKAIIFRALKVAELASPMAVRGAFIPVGQPYDAHRAIGQIIRPALESVLFVDPYMDANALEEFAVLMEERKIVQLLADREYVKPGIGPAVNRWKEQYGELRPVELRITQRKRLHDRLIVVDERDVWLLTQSFNHFAARSPATIVRVDADTAALKVAAFRNMWAEAEMA